MYDFLDIFRKFEIIKWSIIFEKIGYVWVWIFLFFFEFCKINRKVKNVFVVIEVLFYKGIV